MDKQKSDILFNAKNKIFLAPMAGVTDSVFRRICMEYGAGFCYTEMVSGKGLFYNDRKTAELMKITDEEQPCAVQIFGSDAKIMGLITEKAAGTGAAVIDINMGCPTPKIVNNGDGSALMKNPRLAAEVAAEVKKASPVPVTVKIRAGWDDENVNAVEMAKYLEQVGIDAIAVHGRTREQFYSGTADWDIIKAVKRSVKIPVIGNGDIFSAEDAARMFDETGCDAVMVARGAEGNPFIFREIIQYTETGEIPKRASYEERVSLALRHLRMLVEDKGEARGVKEARKHIAWYIKGMPSAARIKEKVFTSGSFAETEDILLEYARAANKN